MNTLPVPFLRAVVLTAVCLLAAPVVSRAENPFKNIGGKIKSGVSNVGSAIKSTAKAAKNIVTTGKTGPPKASAPRATVVQSSKPKTKSAATAKPKAQAAAKPRKSTTTEVSYKPGKPKTAAPDSKPAKSKRKTTARDNDESGGDAGDKPKTRKKTSSATDESDTPPAVKRTGKPDGDQPSEKSTAVPEGWIEVPDAPGEETPAPSSETQPAAAPTETLPFGTPAFGRKGFVYSPYAPEQGLIDVANVAAGTKVRCPYTSKVFRVP